MIIQKQIGYKEAQRIEHKEIGMMINEIINDIRPKNKENKESGKGEFKKWVMPEEPKGYIHTKKNDPL
jgi:hypothetical protein